MFSLSALKKKKKRKEKKRKKSGGQILKYEDIVAKGLVHCTSGQQRVIDPKDLKQDSAYEPVTEKKENKDTTQPPAGALKSPVKWR